MTFARIFKFLVLPGQEAAYATYLRDVVTPIDDAAHKAGVFDRLYTVVPDGESAWNHGRVFLFADTDQRAAFAARMAEQAAIFDGSADATTRRKAFANTLRRQVGISDFHVS